MIILYVSSMDYQLLFAPYYLNYLFQLLRLDPNKSYLVFDLIQMENKLLPFEGIYLHIYVVNK